MPGSTGRPPCRSMRGRAGCARHRSRQTGTGGARRRPRTGWRRAARSGAHCCATPGPSQGIPSQLPSRSRCRPSSAAGTAPRAQRRIAASHHYPVRVSKFSLCLEQCHEKALLPAALWPSCAGASPVLQHGKASQHGVKGLMRQAGHRTGCGRCRRPAGQPPGSNALSPGSAAPRQVSQSATALFTSHIWT